MEATQKYCDKEKYVHDMFSSIAHRYDLLNTVLSFNQDRYWRRFAVAKTGLENGGYGLDVCCGTGKLAVEMARAAGKNGIIFGIDFCDNMLYRAKKNVATIPWGNRIKFIKGNAMNLPFSNNTFDCAVIGFALRNVPDIKRVLFEMQRVVKPGGRVVSLELSKPELPVFKQLYYFYFNYLVPLLGKMGIGFKGPYNYLPSSVKSFPHQKEILHLFKYTGLVDCAMYELTGGVVTVHVGIKR